MKLLIFIVIALVIGAIGISTASAISPMPLGEQDDSTLVQTANGFTSFFSRANQLGATWVRIMAADNRWPFQADQYRAAACQAKFRGYHVLVSLLAFKSHPTTSQWATYARTVAAKLQGCVDLWSPMNEPNLSGFAPASHAGESEGHAYRRVYDAVAPLLPGPKLAGDLMPGSNVQFLNDFWNGHQPAIQPSYIGVHPYYHLPEATDVAQWAFAHNSLPAVTEWGYGPTAKPGDWAYAINRFRKEKFAFTVIYDDLSPHWNTRMPSNAVISAVRSAALSQPVHISSHYTPPTRDQVPIGGTGGARCHVDISSDGLAEAARSDSCTPGTYRHISRAKACQHRTRPSLRASAKRLLLSRYGVPNWTSANGELDHEIPFWMGGRTGHRNIWPQPGLLHGGPKDRLEQYTYNRVCRYRSMRLKHARHIFKTDWRVAYRKYHTRGVI